MLKSVFAFLIVVHCFFLGDAVYAAVKKTPAKLQKDSSTVVVKSFDRTSLSKYHNNRDFNYNGPNDDAPSIWDRFWRWFWNKSFGRLNISPLAGVLLQYGFMALGIGALVYFTFRLTGMDAMKLWKGNSNKSKLDYTESLEDIHEINFDAEIEKAISNQNYRLAVRLLYLKCLKQLSDNNLIKWQIEKTNAAYIYELNDPSQRQAFLLLTRQFEYVWYGGFTVDGSAFQHINQLFQNFKKQLA